jgi:hypothetical protein
LTRQGSILRSPRYAASRLALKQAHWQRPWADAPDSPVQHPLGSGGGYVEKKQEPSSEFLESGFAPARQRQNAEVGLFIPIRANAHPPGKGGNLLLRTACAVPETEEPGKLVHFFRLAEATRRQQWHKAAPQRASWAGPTLSWLSPVDGLRPSRFVYWLSYGSSCLLPRGQVRESYTNKSNVAEDFLIVIHRVARFNFFSLH